MWSILAAVPGVSGRLRPQVLVPGHWLSELGGLCGWGLWPLASGPGPRPTGSLSWAVWVAGGLWSPGVLPLTCLSFPCVGCACLSTAWPWAEQWYNGSSIRSLPMSFFVVIETLWVLATA
jgi:hypothetical protein